VVNEGGDNLLEFGFVDGPHLTHHDDLFVRIGQNQVVCDSYYFELWEHQGQYAGLNAFVVLSDAVTRWIRTVTRAVAPARLFIPFGLNDQDVLWIVVSFKGDGCVRVGTAWNFENGYDIDPVDGIRCEEPRDLQFDPDTEITVSAEVFLQTLKQFQARIDRELAELGDRIRTDSGGSPSRDADCAD
jgi:hypothetical protein